MRNHAADGGRGVSARRKIRLDVSQQALRVFGIEASGDGGLAEARGQEKTFDQENNLHPSSQRML
jgi:hypothetical protein